MKAASKSCLRRKHFLTFSTKAAKNNFSFVRKGFESLDASCDKLIIIFTYFNRLKDEKKLYQKFKNIKCNNEI